MNSEKSTSMARSVQMLAVLFLASAALAVCWADDAAPQAMVRERSGDVMPFDLGATTHLFTKAWTSGVQQVVTKDASDSKQAKLVRAHLTDIAQRFGRRDPSDPTHVHGAGMPGLAALKASAPGDPLVQYRDVLSGGEIEYRSDRPAIVTALKEWFDAHVADRGWDAMMRPDHAMPHWRTDRALRSIGRPAVPRGGC